MFHFLNASRLLILILLMVGCTHSEQLPKLGQDAVILAFGDSITYGTGAMQDHSYPAQLAMLTGLKVVNAGVPGEETSGGLKRLPAVLDIEKPALLILCEGGNDILRKRDRDGIKANLRSMIEIAQQRGIPVLLIAVPDFGILLSPAEFYEALANEMNVPIASSALPDVLSRGLLKSDVIHPNARGYRQLADDIFTRLQEAGAL